MKKITLTIMMMGCISITFAQTQWQYCEVVAITKILSKKSTITIDYGEESSFWKWNPEKDADGNKIVFNTAIDAINYMGDKGWELIGFSDFTNGGVTTYRYMMKRKVDDEGE